MKCPNCKTKILNNCKFCIRCGNIFDKQQFLKEQDTNIEIKLIKEVINYNNFNEFFSKKYLFLNFIYAFYKKLYFTGIISFICVIFLVYFVNYKRFLTMIFSSYGLYFQIIILGIMFSIFILGYYVCNFNKIYFEKVYFKVCNIVMNNKNLEFEQLKILCENEFKPSIILPIISVILFIFIMRLIIRG